MKLEIKNFKGNPASILRQAGYVFQRKENDELSFVRPLTSAGYPRFHIYAFHGKNNLTINIHIDRKKETYGKSRRHHGEYGNNGTLKEEAERLRNELSS